MSQETGETVSGDRDEAADTLNWSVSCIDDQGLEHHYLTSDTSRASSRMDSPDFNYVPQSQPQNEDMHKLMTAMKSLVASSHNEPSTLESENHMRISDEEISFKCVTAEFTDDTIDDGEDTERSETLREGSKDKLNMTPPVRDPGLSPRISESVRNSCETTPVNSKSLNNSTLTSSGSVRMEKMRSMMRDLEASKNRQSISKIPRKTLSFIPTINKSSYNIGDSDNLNNAASRNGDQVAILDGHSVTFKARRPSSTNSSAVEQNTVIEVCNFQSSNQPDSKQVEDLKSRLSEVEGENGELRKKLESSDKQNEEMMATINALRAELLASEQRLTQTQDSDSAKDLQIKELKLKMSKSFQEFSSEQEKRLEELKEKQDENSRLKKEMAEAKQQVLVCEEELEKALKLAADFRLKFEEEELMRSHLVQELAEEREKVKQIENKCEQLETEICSLEKKLKFLETRMSTSEKTAKEMKKAKEEYEVLLVKERERLRQEMAKMEEKHSILASQIATEQARQSQSEAKLHNYYQAQIEEKLSELIEQFKSHVDQLQKLMEEEAKSEKEKLKQNFTSEMKKFVSDFAEEKSSYESSLLAARQEADCLREQLKHALKLSKGKNNQKHELDYNNLIKK